MRCFYINLDRASERRAALEANFERMRRPGWSLTRVAATDAKSLDLSGIETRLTPPEVACIRSHVQVLRNNLDHSDPILVLEDDAMFGAASCGLVEQAVQAGSSGWDILWTDIGVSTLSGMQQIFRQTQIAKRAGVQKLLDLRNFEFYGATSYVVNSRARQTIVDLFDALESPRFPMDMELRRAVATGLLKGAVIIPYPMTISDEAFTSNIQPGKKATLDAAWNVFRRLNWIEGGSDSLGPAVALVEAELSANDRALGVVLAKVSQTQAGLR